jgi:Domain of unknown function (DUF4160)
MPEISRFYGIAVTMYHNDHGIPHFHVYYAEEQASFSIDGLEMLEGKFPRRAARLVREWARMHRNEIDRQLAIGSPGTSA